MTKNISEEELLLRKRASRRLVGAIVLVIFSIIVLPMIFDEPKPDNEEHEIAINLPNSGKNAKNGLAPVPKAESAVRETLDNLDVSSELKGKPQTNQQSIEDTAETSSDRKRIPIPGIKPKIYIPPAEVKHATPAPVASNPPTSVVADAPKDTAKGFVVQLGAFSDSSKAKQQHSNLLSGGFNAYTETLKVDQNEVTRVRVGPFATRNAAEAELKKLKKLGLDGVVSPK